MKNCNEVCFLSYEDATDLVERIAERTKDFGHIMTTNEKEAMSHLLSECGVMTSDLINVDNLADNYAINAELLHPDDIREYNVDLNDALFTWEEKDGTFACMSW